MAILGNIEPRQACHKRKSQVQMVILLCSMVILVAAVTFSVLCIKHGKQPETAEYELDPMILESLNAGKSHQQTRRNTGLNVAINSDFSSWMAIETKSIPQSTDPTTWNEAGKMLMEWLEADPYYQSIGFTASVDKITADRGTQRRSISAWQSVDDVFLPDIFPYLLAVNRAADTVTVYTPDSDGRYTVPYMSMICSTGAATPTGFYYTPINYPWQLLYGSCYGQYCTRIVNSILFHSVPYYTQHKDDLEYDEFNLLGTPASLGCIRLMVVDAKWIYDNCPIGTPVVIYDDTMNPGPMGKPATIYIYPTNENKRSWDPTDPDPSNPWDEEYLPGTAIRSAAAWNDYNDAVASGRWLSSLTGTNLRRQDTTSVESVHE